MKVGKPVVAAVFGLLVLGIALIIAPYVLDATSRAIPAPIDNVNLNNSLRMAQGNATVNATAGLGMANISPILTGVGILLAVLGGFMAISKK